MTGKGTARRIRIGWHKAECLTCGMIIIWKGDQAKQVYFAFHRSGCAGIPVVIE